MLNEISKLGSNYVELFGFTLQWCHLKKALIYLFPIKPVTKVTATSFGGGVAALCSTMNLWGKNSPDQNNAFL